MSDIDKAGMMNAIAEGLRTSTLERFRTEESPDGKKWKRSIRAEKSGGKTLTKTKQLGTSIHAQSDSTGLAVGTNVIYAATHQMDQQATGKCEDTGERISGYQ